MTTYNYPSDTGTILIVIENIVTLRVKQVKTPYLKYKNDSKGSPYPITAYKNGEVLEINGIEIGDCRDPENSQEARITLEKIIKMIKEMKNQN